MGGAHDFPETRRSIWAAIRRGGPHLEKVLTTYRDPIVAWLRRRGLTVEDAEDVAQDVLSRLAGSVLERACPERGRLRALVKAVSRHALLDHRRTEKAQKRGGRARRVPLEEIEPASDETDDGFDAEWALNLVLQAIYRLLDGATDGRRRQVDFVYQHALKGRGTGELARELGVSAANAKVLLHRGRKLVAREVRSLVREYAASRSELEDELAYLERLMPGEIACR
ncbi:RNA polymerase sigma factor [bacterium]|nr:RNA polymerase sigma factor [bacterium]